MYSNNDKLTTSTPIGGKSAHIHLESRCNIKRYSNFHDLELGALEIVNMGSESAANASSAGVNPLLNVHVVEIIFSYLKFQTLLNCRLVCQTWNEETLRLLERNAIKASIKGDQALKHFMNCVQNSFSHPFTSFAIDLPSTKDPDDVYELLETLRNCMKFLKFEYEPLISSSEGRFEMENDENFSTDNEIHTSYSNQPNRLAIGQQITGNNVTMSSQKPEITLPLLTSLHLFSTNIFPPKSTNRMPQLFDLLKTPNLTNLSVQHLYATECAETVIKFLSSSNKPVSSLKIPCTEFPKICGRVNLDHLKELDICDLFHGQFATNQTIQRIQESCPNLETLSIELGCRVIFSTVYKLLDVLSHSIVNLKLIIQDKNLLSRNVQRVNWYFPGMPKLKSLFLRFANPGLVYYIDSMPQLISLELETPWTRRVRGNIFPGVESKVYHGIKILTLSEKLTAEDVAKMRLVFPNLTTLCTSFKSNEALLEVYKSFKKLECLIVDRNSSISDFGICSEQVLKLAEHLIADNRVIGINDVELQNFYDASSPDEGIGDLKYLKSLKLVQAGLTWKSLVFGVCFLKELHSITIQSTTLKINNRSILENNLVPQCLCQQLPKLDGLAVWVRRNVERLSTAEMKHLSNNYPQWEIDVTLQTVCSAT